MVGGDEMENEILEIVRQRLECVIPLDMGERAELVPIIGQDTAQKRSLGLGVNTVGARAKSPLPIGSPLALIMQSRGEHDGLSNVSRKLK